MTETAGELVFVISISKMLATAVLTGDLLAIRGGNASGTADATAKRQNLAVHNGSVR